MDPRLLGAKCDVCPLRDKTPVLSEAHSGDWIACIGEAPGEQEEKYGRPFVGPSGMEFERSLRVAGLRREEVFITNALLCRPPGNDLKGLLSRISAKNKERKAQAKKQNEPFVPIPSPLDCCRPRLLKEIERFSYFITLGKVGAEQAFGIKGSVLSYRGGLHVIDGKQVMPTIHPALVLRYPRWAPVLRNDLQKAVKWFVGQIRWKPPEVVYHPDAETLERFLFDPNRKEYAFDIETDNLEPLTANIRCIAIGDRDKVVVVGFRSQDRHPEAKGLFLDFYTQREGQRVAAVLKRFFEDGSRIKIGHNAGYYDRLVLKSQMGIEVEPVLDTMLLHKSAESEMPHNLAYVTSMYGTFPAWKTDREGRKLATGGETDHELHQYCAYDTAAAFEIFSPLANSVQLREQAHVWVVDQKMQQICADMHEVGMYVDQARRLAEEKKLLARRHALLCEIRDMVGNDKFNPGSVYQLRDLLFGKWKLQNHLLGDDEIGIEKKELHTSSGDLSTSDLVLRSLLTTPGVPEFAREVIKRIRHYRKCMKVLGTYVVKLRPWDMDADLGWDEDDEWADEDTRERYGEKRKGITNPVTGRMHPGYNAHVAVTGRLSSSKPINAQNFPAGLRAIVVAQPGHVLVGADMDQLELRIAAALWGVRLYLRAFNEGKDAHSMTAYAIFGQAFCEAAGISPAAFDAPGKLVGKAYDELGNFVKSVSSAATSMRNLAKGVQYSSQYMGSVETVAKLIRKIELPAIDPKTGKPYNDGTTDMPYARMPLRRVRQMREKWLRGAPEFEQGWKREIAEYRRQGYLLEPVGKRRRDFLDGEDPNQIVNFKVQASAAALMNKALIQLREHIPPFKWGPGTGIINQCHDSIVVECPEDKAEEVARLIEECMNQEHPALPGVKFTAEAAIGKTWKDV